MVTVTVLGLAGCGKKAKRQLYNDKLSKYITLADYKGLKVDTKSDEFKEYYDNMISSDVSANDLYVRKTEGTVANGDTANIDYTGKKDGVAFDGGTAAGYDLTIGSNSFIDGFESGLIGKKIGDTVDLNLTFPESYSSTELAGKAVVFTVKINYVKTDEERKPEDYYSELGFKSLDEYTADVTEDSFKEDMVTNQIKPAMDEQMVAYSILDNEKLGLKDEEVSKKIDETVKSINNSQVTADTVKSYYGEYYFEYMTVSEKVADFLYKNAKIS